MEPRLEPGPHTVAQGARLGDPPWRAEAGKGPEGESSCFILPETVLPLRPFLQQEEEPHTGQNLGAGRLPAEAQNPQNSNARNTVELKVSGLKSNLQEIVL